MLLQAGHFRGSQIDRLVGLDQVALGLEPLQRVAERGGARCTTFKSFLRTAFAWCGRSSKRGFGGQNSACKTSADWLNFRHYW